MKILTKKDKRILELENEIELLRAINAPHICKIERELVTLEVTERLPEGVPVAMIERRIASKLAEKVAEQVEYNVFDDELDPSNPFKGRIMRGIVRIAVRK